MSRINVFSFAAHRLRLPVIVAGFSALLLGGFPSTGVGAQQEFFLNDPMGLSYASIEVDSQLLPVRGHIMGLEGTARFDPEDVGRLQADVTIPVKNLFLGSFLVTEQVLSDRWLDAESYPEIRLNVKGVEDVTQFTDDTWSLNARCALVLRGRAGGVDFPATVTYIPDGMTERSDGKIEGDLLVFRGELSFRRSTWGISPETAIVSGLGDVIDVEFTAVGHTIRSARK